jgi:hypothetical protein
MWSSYLKSLILVWDDYLTTYRWSRNSSEIQMGSIYNKSQPDSLLHRVLYFTFYVALVNNTQKDFIRGKNFDTLDPSN